MVKLDKDKVLPKFGEWGRYFEPIFETGILDEIFTKLKERSNEKKIICPDSDNVFKTFIATEPGKLNTVFLLLDPYPSIINGTKVATGIAMDCSATGRIQPSLEKWYEAIEHSECKGLNLDLYRNSSLEFYYNQGIMFLNTALTTEYLKTGSHSELWKPFTKWVIEEVFNKYFPGLIYVLCGKESQKFERYISPFNAHIYSIEHPSAAARSMRMWNYDNIFKIINSHLLDLNNISINWVDEEAPF